MISLIDCLAITADIRQEYATHLLYAYTVNRRCRQSDFLGWRANDVGPKVPERGSKRWSADRERSGDDAPFPVFDRDPDFF